VSVFGADLNELDRAANDIARIVGALPGAQDLQVDLESGLPTVRIRPIAQRLAAFGVRPVDIFDAVAVAYQGAIVSQVYDGNQSLAVRVLLEPAARQDPETVGQLLIKTSAGRSVPLSMLAEVALDSGRARVLHESGLRRQVVTVNPATRDVVGFVATVKRTLAQQLQLPQGVSLEFGGTAEGARAAAQDLTLHSLAAALGVLLLLMFAFADWRSVALILVNVPFALVGGVVAVALTGGAVSIGALVGFVTLFGISGRNTIMLISHYEYLVSVEGRRWTLLAAMRGARERLTPILMTASVTALGLLPLAIGNGEAGREVEGPMAVVILGGLISSTLLNLLVMPALAARYLSLHTKSAGEGVAAAAT
jgi:Cu/Ag efflux pump CusA